MKDKTIVYEPIIMFNECIIEVEKNVLNTGQAPVFWKNTQINVTTLEDFCINCKISKSFHNFSFLFTKNFLRNFQQKLLIALMLLNHLCIL